MTLLTSMDRVKISISTSSLLLELLIPKYFQIVKSIKKFYRTLYWIKNHHFLCSPFTFLKSISIIHPTKSQPSQMKRKSVNVPKPTHFQNGEQINISCIIKFCTKKTLSLIHPAQSHSIPPNPTRGGWSGFGIVTLGPIPLQFHSNPTKTQSTKLPNNDFGWF